MNYSHNMDELYRTDPPISIDQLAHSEVDLDLAVESLFYYQVHERPSRWTPMIIAMRKWFDLVRLLRSEGLTHKGYDYPDWRQFANLDFTMPTRELLRTKLRWYTGFNFTGMHDLVVHNEELLGQKDVISNMAHIRVGLESEQRRSDHLEIYVLSLLHCKYYLIKGDAETHDSLLPIYNNLYSLLLVKFDLHPIIFKEDAFWLVHSTLFLFPYEVGLLDINTFEDPTSWLTHSAGLVLCNLGDNDEG